MRRLLIFLTITIIFITVINSETSECVEEEKTCKITIFFKGLDTNNLSENSIQVIYKTDNENEHGKEIGGKCKHGENKNMLEIPLSIEDGQLNLQNCYLCFDNMEKEGYCVDNIHFPEFIDHCPNEITCDLEGGGSEKVTCYRLAVSGKNLDYGEKYTIIVEQSKYTVTGKVFTKNGGSSEPIYFSGVKVSLCGDKDKEVASSISNNGEYSITYNAGGKYKIECNFSGYEAYEEEVRFDKSQKDYIVNVELKADNAFFDIPHLLMIIGGIIAVIILMIAIVHRAFIYRTYKKTSSPFKR